MYVDFSVKPFTKLWVSSVKWNETQEPLFTQVSIHHCKYDYIRNLTHIIQISLTNCHKYTNTVHLEIRTGCKYTVFSHNRYTKIEKCGNT